jgi:membrane protein
MNCAKSIWRWGLSVRDPKRGQGSVPETHGETDRGREADSPTQIPPRGWKDVLLRVKQDIKDDQISIIAAGVAFFAMLALFPALIALISIYGLVVEPAEAAAQVKQLTDIMPPEAAKLIGDQMTTVASANSGSLSLGLALSIATALWSASSGMKALIEGVNIAYDEPETRGFFKLRGLALLLTIGGIVVFCLAIGAIAVFPALAGKLPGGEVLETVAGVLRWVVLAVVIIGALAVIFRLSPDRDQPRMKWTSSGAVLATVFWLLASIGFSFYTQNFGKYTETYGAAGAVIILLFWLYITAFIILVGAELNSQLELQTRKDTTTGPEKPMGERDAFAADKVADAPEKKSRKR